MSSRVRFITSVSCSLGDKWQWTKPCNTPRASTYAAENMVSARLMEDREIRRDFDNFGTRLRNMHPEIVEEAQQYIGETREVILPENMTPKQFQKEFHTIQFDSEQLGESTTNCGGDE